MTTTEEQIWQLLESVPDPEIPVLSVIDLGIVRGVAQTENGIDITITPTYSGCPAMDMISMQIRLVLLEAGYPNVLLKSVLSPAWTTDWMSAEGKEKLKTYGIAPPKILMPIPEDGVECPQCHSTDTRLVSEFGSTACKALYQCNLCREPFDYFKCH